MEVKARVNATGEIVEVVRLDECMRGIVMYKTAEGDIYTKDSLEFDYYNNPDYWTRLEHQAGIASLQGLILTASKHMGTDQEVAQWAYEYAHAFVEKMKNTNE